MVAECVRFPGGLGGSVICLGHCGSPCPLLALCPSLVHFPSSEQSVLEIFRTPLERGRGTGLPQDVSFWSQ